MGARAGLGARGVRTGALSRPRSAAVFPRGWRRKSERLESTAHLRTFTRFYTGKRAPFLESNECIIRCSFGGHLFDGSTNFVVDLESGSSPLSITAMDSSLALVPPEVIHGGDARDAATLCNPRPAALRG